MRFPITIRYNDYDTKGHINNAVYFTYFEMARTVAWLEGVQGPEDFSFIVAEAHIRYLSQGMIGDPLDIEIRTIEVRNKAWVWSYVIRDTRDDRVVAEGSTVQVMFDYDRRATVPIPVELRERLAGV